MPISSVIRASNNISKGTYGTKSKTNDYIELNRLVNSFNKMSVTFKNKENK